VKPILVAEVKYSQVTNDGGLRAPVFVRLREDKIASEVTPLRITPAPRQLLPAQLGLPIDARGATDLAEQIRHAGERATIEVEGRQIKLTNLNKELWPSYGEATAITKREFLIYLAEVSGYVLPHLKDRPLTAIRLPNGINGQRWFQRHPPEQYPDFLETVHLVVQGDEDSHVYFVCNNLASLIWLGQMAGLELHASYARVVPEPDALHIGSDPNRLYDFPDFLVFDLDPYIYSGNEPKGEEPELNRPAWEKCSQVALWLKSVLDSLRLASFVKTTGKTGLHVFVPIVRNLDYTAVRSVAETIGLHLVKAHPKDVTTEWSVQKRTGKIFVDVNQNVRAKTVAAIFSPRSVAEAAVSVPLRWDEIGSVYPTDFTIRTASERLAEVGDPWADILESKKDLVAAVS